MCCPYRLRGKPTKEEFDELESVLYSLERDIIAEEGEKKCRKNKE